MANVATYDTRMHARDPMASDIRITDAYIIAFTYAAAASRKQDC